MKYLFSQVPSAKLTHQSLGSCGFDGKGEIDFKMPTAGTAQDVAADGSVMGSKIHEGGFLTIECHQDSNLHKYLLDIFNKSVDKYIEVSIY